MEFFNKMKTTVTYRKISENWLAIISKVVRQRKLVAKKEEKFFQRICELHLDVQSLNFKFEVHKLRLNSLVAP